MTKTIVFQTPDMSCNHCVMTIERTLKAVPGVSDAHADLPTKSVRFSAADDAAVAAARAALAEAGYPVAN